MLKIVFTAAILYRALSHSAINFEIGGLVYLELIRVAVANNIINWNCPMNKDKFSL